MRRLTYYYGVGGPIFLTSNRLMKNAEGKAKEGGEKRIAARDIRKVTMVSLLSCPVSILGGGWSWD
jgi:hypothetical protein